MDYPIQDFFFLLEVRSPLAAILQRGDSSGETARLVDEVIDADTRFNIALAARCPIILIKIATEAIRI